MGLAFCGCASAGVAAAVVVTGCCDEDGDGDVEGDGVAACVDDDGDGGCEGFAGEDGGGLVSWTLGRDSG